MKTLFIILFLCTGIVIAPPLSHAQGLLLDDFEGQISGGPEGTVNSGAEGGSSVEVTVSPSIKYSGKQALKVTYKTASPTSSYILVSKGADFSPHAHWLIEPEEIAWQDYSAIAFYMYGSDSKANIAFDIIDNGFEVWRFIVEDNFIGWKQIVCPFSEFRDYGGDWQTGKADNNHTLDFPIRDFQIEPSFEPLPDGKIKEGTFYFDKVELIAAGTAPGRAQNLLLDDFEDEISSGPEGTVDVRAGIGSSAEVTASPSIKYSGKQALKVTYKTASPTSSYVWVYRNPYAGLNTNGLDKPEDISWQDYSAIDFYMYGSDSKANITFDIIDNGFEVWRFIFTDNFTGWKQIVCPFSEFRVRSDWQPDNADKNAKLDFPIRAFTIEFSIKPSPDGKIKEGTFYFDKVELTP